MERRVLSKHNDSFDIEQRTNMPDFNECERAYVVNITVQAGCTHVVGAIAELRFSIRRSGILR